MGRFSVAGWGGAEGRAGKGGLEGEKEALVGGGGEAVEEWGANLLSRFLLDSW